ncbi:MAG: helix-turn-helix domain-containing protein [Cyanobacteria bacterium]|nr:helix-turn-helix domain-containing protein [Cyanobacteriota bacterium]
MSDPTCHGHRSQQNRVFTTLAKRWGVLRLLFETLDTYRKTRLSGILSCYFFDLRCVLPSLKCAITMKPSERKLGLEIQLFMLRNSITLERLSSALGMTSEGLSNLLHGRRRFKDDTLKKLLATSYFDGTGITLQQLKAYRAMDEYTAEELLLAVTEYLKNTHLKSPPQASPHSALHITHSVQEAFWQEVTRQQSGLNPLWIKKRS